MAVVTAETAPEGFLSPCPAPSSQPLWLMKPTSGLPGPSSLSSSGSLKNHILSRLASTPGSCPEVQAISLECKVDQALLNFRYATSLFP